MGAGTCKIRLLFTYPLKNVKFHFLRKLKFWSIECVFKFCPLCILKTGTLANSEDPDEMQHNAAIGSELFA